MTSNQTLLSLAALSLAHGVAGVGDRGVVGGIIDGIGNGLRWRDAPPAYGPQTLYNRFIRWSRLGVFERIFSCPAASDCPGTPMMDGTAHRTATGLLKNGAFARRIGGTKGGL